MYLQEDVVDEIKKYIYSSERTGINTDVGMQSTGVESEWYR